MFRETTTTLLPRLPLLLPLPLRLQHRPRLPRLLPRRRRLLLPLPFRPRLSLLLSPLPRRRRLLLLPMRLSLPLALLRLLRLSLLLRLRYVLVLVGCCSHVSSGKQCSSPSSSSCSGISICFLFFSHILQGNNAPAAPVRLFLFFVCFSNLC